MTGSRPAPRARPGLLSAKGKKTATSQGWPLLFVGQKSAGEEVDT